MRYIKVNTAEPFVVVCDGAYQEQLAHQRLDRDPFSYTSTDVQDSPWPKHYMEITLTNFLNLHSNPNKTRDRASYVLSDSNDGVITTTALMVRNALLVCDNNAQAAIEFVKRWGGTGDDPVIGPVITELKTLI